jgi:hypothetical protein
VYWRGAPGSGSPGGYIQVDVVIVLLPHQIPLTHPIISARRRKLLIADAPSGTVLTLLNNCKDKGHKGLHFSQQKGKIMNNSRVGIFIKQHTDQVQTPVNTGNVVLPRNRKWKTVNYEMVITA